MRGYDKFNFPAFDDASARLRAAGHEVRSPTENDREMGFDPSLNTLQHFDLAAAFRWDIESVLWAEAVVVLPGWEDSEGCQIETSVAGAIGTPVYPLDIDVIWITRHV
jgi:hypothetical protein